MKVASILFKDHQIVKEKNQDNLDYNDAQLVIGFGSRELVSQGAPFAEIKRLFPNANIALCSTAGEIFGREVLDDSLSLIATQFDSTQIVAKEINIDDYETSYIAGQSIVKSFSQDGLKLLFVISDGGKVNGSELIKGINAEKNEGVVVTGGLAGDATRFEQTVVGLNNVPTPGKIVVIGFYGDKFQVSHGSMGGWETFGIEKTVTNSVSNVLYEIDNKIALDLYRNYLGSYSDELPGSALLFPLSVKLPNSDQVVVRTILSIDEKTKAMTFAGDIPMGSKVYFMRSNMDKLIDAAEQAAGVALTMNDMKPKLSLLVSCVGRKLVLNNRVEEEVEAVLDTFGTEVTNLGFYSYGEISPLQEGGFSELHNQTMTITCINELE